MSLSIFILVLIVDVMKVKGQSYAVYVSLNKILVQILTMFIRVPC